MGKRIWLVNPPVLAVSKAQLYNYAEPYPYGLLKAGALLKKLGNEVRLIDMMVYDHLEGARAEGWPRTFKFHSFKRAGAKSVGDCLMPAYVLGRNAGYLKGRLIALGRPDEIWVTACLTFNWETAHEAVKICKETYPNARVLLGGNYPTLVPNHARKSLADVIAKGVIEDAEWQFGDLSLFEHRPAVGLFNLGTGCSNRCSFCVNHGAGPVLRHSPASLANYLLETSKRFGIRHFSNWDPNVTLFPAELENFLDLMTAARSGLTFSFNMGIQPDRLTRRLAEKMMRAGVVQLTVPFESSEKRIWSRFRKPYGFNDSVKTIKMLRDIGFDLGNSHATVVFGYDDEEARPLFSSYFQIARYGLQPDFFPITPTPTSEEYRRLLPKLRGKRQDELNGYLFPLLGSKEKVELYSLLLDICCRHKINDAARLASRLPPDLERVFNEELDRSLKQPL